MKGIAADSFSRAGIIGAFFEVASLFAFHNQISFDTTQFG
jgi:hypothetical protein